MQRRMRERYKREEGEGEYKRGGGGVMKGTAPIW